MCGYPGSEKRSGKQEWWMINFDPNQGDNIPPSLQMLAPDADWDPKGLSAEN